MKKQITKIDKLLFFYPKIVTLLGAKFEEKINFMAVAWNTPLSFDPPMFGVAITKKRHTHSLIKKAGEFTCNFLPSEKAEIVHKCGRVTGADVDKVARLHLDLEPPTIIHSPGLKEAYAILECRLKEVIPIGDHDFLVGQVVVVRYEESYFDERGVLRPEVVNPTLYLGSDTYVTTNPKSVVKRERNVVL